MNANTPRMTFNQWWSEEGQWVEPPNARRGGMSGVMRLYTSNGTYYIKRQVGHIHRSLLHPLGRPTALREHRALVAMPSLGVGVPDVVFCEAQKASDGQWNALLVTKELSGFIDSDRWFAEDLDLALSGEQRNHLMQHIGAMLARMHQGRWQHGCLYGKHVFINLNENGPKAALLDFEKCRQRLTRSQAANRDMPQLRRHSRFSDNDWKDIMQGYQCILPHRITT